MTTLLGQEYEEIDVDEVQEVGAVDYLNHGFSFLQSARTLNEEVESLGPHKYAPVYFCIVHAYELLMKSFLLYCGAFTSAEITKKTTRHDLEILLSHVKENGFVIENADEYEIQELNKYTGKHEFRYPKMGDKFLRDTDLLLDLGERLHADIITFVRQKEL